MREIPLNMARVFLAFSLSSGPLVAAEVTVSQILASDTAWDQSALPGYTSGRPEMRLVKFRIEPGAKTAIHTHPSNGAGYVISGELTMLSTSDPHGRFTDPATVKEITLRAGDAWAEAVNVWHYGENRGSIPVDFVVAFASQKGTPSTLAAPSP